jgi:hypothetical protein
MRKGFLSSLSLLLVSAGLALAQAQEGDILQQNSLPADIPNAFDPDIPEPCGFAWASGEFIWWWITSSPQPGALVTTAPPGSTAVLGNKDTTVLFGGDDFGNSERFGGRATLGWVFQYEHRAGLEVSFFAVGDRSSTFGAQSDATGNPTIARPVVNALSGRETALFVAVQNQFQGGVAGSLQSSLFGGDVNLFYNCFSRTVEYPDFFLGFRYLNLDEDFHIDQRTTLLPNGLGGFNGGLVRPGDALALTDRFSTLNEFLGGQVGIRQQFERGCAFLNVQTSVAFGTTRQTTDIRGSTTFTEGFTGGTTTVPGGLLALASNSGHFTRNEFTVVPEVKINAGYYLTCNLQAFVGYNFIYWSSVVRPGTEIDRVVSPTQLPTSLSFGIAGGPPRPAHVFNPKDVMIQGLNFGLAYRF